MVENNNFNIALKFIRPIEGFISTDPDDRGGLTIFGISSKSHKKAVLKMKELIDSGKKEEAYEIAKKIYYEVYWLKPGCNTLPFPFNVVVFDTAVNCGRSTATRLLNTYSDWKDYLLRRLDYHNECRTARKHIWGWSRRIVKLYKFVKKQEGR